MQFLRKEFERVAGRHGMQELHINGFAPEQIYHQIEEMCCSILVQSQETINRLYPFYEEIEQQEKICCGEQDPISSEEQYFEQDPEAPGHREAAGEDGSEDPEAPEDNLLSSDDFDMSDNEISLLPAEEAIRLLSSNARKNPDLYVSDESENYEDDLQ